VISVSHALALPLSAHTITIAAPGIAHGVHGYDNWLLDDLIASGDLEPILPETNPNVHRVPKRIPDIFSGTLSMHCPILQFLAKHYLEIRQSKDRLFFHRT